MSASVIRRTMRNPFDEIHAQTWVRSNGFELRARDEPKVNSIAKRAIIHFHRPGTTAPLKECSEFSGLG
jgi:hypothetical protein